MEKPGLGSVVQDSYQRGVPADALRELLLKAGWPLDMVKEHIDRVYRDVPDGKAFLAARGLVKGFGARPVLDGIDLDVLSGEIFGIIGQSGSGKTTLLGLLVGFLEPDAGDVSIRTSTGLVSVFKSPEVVKRLFGFAAQVPSFYENLTARENVEHFASLYGIPVGKRRTESLLRAFKLEDARDTLARNLSGGMKKRLDIACAMVHNPRVLILDEPTADLDSVIAQEIWDLVVDINKRGTTVILASHFVQEIERVCHRIGILRNRRVVDVGTPDELRVLYTPYHEVVIETGRASYDALVKLLRSRNDLGIQKVERKGRSLMVISGAPEQVLQFVLRSMTDDVLVRLSVQRPSVQDAFESLVKR